MATEDADEFGYVPPLVTVVNIVDGSTTYGDHEYSEVSLRWGALPPVEHCEFSLSGVYNRTIGSAGYNYRTWVNHYGNHLFAEDWYDEAIVCWRCGEVEYRRQGTLDEARRASGVLESNCLLCGSCASQMRTCGFCNNRTADWASVGQTWACIGCRNDRDILTFCDSCSLWYPVEEYRESEHMHPGRHCRCESPVQEFRIRNDGHGTLANDDRVTLTVAKGVISEEGMRDIYRTVTVHANTHYALGDMDTYRRWLSIATAINGMDPQVQTKDGNFTKRASKLAYKMHKEKMPPDLVSQIGNLAAMHSAGSTLNIEVTRDLNQGPGDFAHEDSCWWGSYAKSRCCLKSNGGFGLRSFDDEGWVSGRAWVLPLKGNGARYRKYRLEPTFETLDPDAFLVFNCYGALHGYIPARVMAHLSGMSYCRVDLHNDEDVIYINGCVGYLVAPPDLVSEYTDGVIDLMKLRPHADLYAEESAIIMKETAHV